MAVKTIKELIDMKAGFEEKRNKVYTLKTKELGEVKYKLASRTEVIQVQDMGKEDIDPYLIYTHVVEPKLNDTELQKAYQMTGIEPFKIIDKLFSISDIGDLSLAIIGRGKDNDVVKTIKN